MKQTSLRKNGGFAAVYGIVVLLVASIAGISLMTISQKDNLASIDQVKMRKAMVSAEAALTAVEQQCENKPDVILDIINKYVAAGASTDGKGWLLSSAENWQQETRISLDSTVSNPPQYSARILSYDKTTKIMQVEGYGYGGGGGRKKAIGIYQLSGLTQSTPYKKHALYMRGEADYFDKPVNITGNVYFADKVTSNGMFSSVINGTFQAMSPTKPVLLQTTFTFNGNTLFMGPTELRGAQTFNKKAGFDKVVTLVNGPAQAKDELFLNNSISSNNTIFNIFNLNGKVAHITSTYSGNSSYLKGGTVVQDGLNIDVASAVELSSTEVEPFIFDTSGIPISCIQNVSGTISAFTINDLASKSTLWKGYLVLSPADETSIKKVGGNTLNCNTIWIINDDLLTNDGWFISGPNTMTVLYCRDKAKIQGFGSAGYFRGYLHATDKADITYAWLNGNNFVGAVHHVSKNTKFQMNSAGPVWNLTWSDEVIEKLVSDGLIKLPNGTGTADQLILSDFNLKPKILGKYL